jgi:hypothetical protein
MAKLTDKGISGLKPQKERYEKWDGVGFENDNGID